MKAGFLSGVAGSLRGRLLWATIVAGLLTLVLVGFLLTELFRDHVVSQFEAALVRQLDQLAAELDFPASGPPVLHSDAALDPRTLKPYSGVYWQVDAVPSDQPARIGVLRSRSLWDAALDLPAAAGLQAGKLAIREGRGPNGESLLILQRIVIAPATGGARYRLIFAGDLRFNLEATGRFGVTLALGLLVLLLLLTLSAWAQVGLVLRPLGALQQALKAVREGRSERLAGRFPSEIQPLVDDFNQVLGTNAAIVERARTHAGNLAHALKTPLSILENEAARAASTFTPMPAALVQEQIARLRQQIDWHLRRARIVASQGVPGQRTDVVEVASGLMRLFDRVFAERQLEFSLHAPQPLFFAGEAQDLQEMLGNLLENACKWARHEVGLSLLVDADPRYLRILVEDDGPGIAPDKLELVKQRGVRLDETVPGSGLGLAIVQDLVRSYAGDFALVMREDGSGVRATLRLLRVA